MNALQLKMARTALSLTVRQAAELAGCSHETIVGIEAGRSSVKPSTIEKVQSALEKAGVEFVDENGGGAGVRLAKRSETVADLKRQINTLQADMTPALGAAKPSPNRAMKQLRRAHDQNELAVLKNRRARLAKPKAKRKAKLKPKGSKK